MTSVTDRVSQHNIRLARSVCKTKTAVYKTKTKTTVYKIDFFWSQTGLVLRLTVSDHITAKLHQSTQFKMYCIVLLAWYNQITRFLHFYAIPGFL